MLNTNGRRFEGAGSAHILMAGFFHCLDFIEFRLTFLNIGLMECILKLVDELKKCGIHVVPMARISGHQRGICTEQLRFQMRRKAPVFQAVTDCFKRLLHSLFQNPIIGFVVRPGPVDRNIILTFVFDPAFDIWLPIFLSDADFQFFQSRKINRMGRGFNRFVGYSINDVLKQRNGIFSINHDFFFVSRFFHDKSPDRLQSDFIPGPLFQWDKGGDILSYPCYE